MINVHIGMPRIGIRDFRFLGSEVSLEHPAETLLVTQSEFSTSLRSVINTRRRDFDESFTEVVQAYRTSIRKFKRVSFSLPSLLGTPEGLMLSGRERRRAARRLKRLREIFDDAQVRLHIQIEEPYRYLGRYLCTDLQHLESRLRIFTWSSLLDDLNIPSLDSNVIVWRWDDPELYLEQFICELFDQRLRYIAPGSKIDKSNLFQALSSDRKQRNSDELDRISMQIIRYESDLSLIKHMGSLTLIGGPA